MARAWQWAAHGSRCWRIFSAQMVRWSFLSRCDRTWAWTSFLARRKPKTLRVRNFARGGLAGWADEDHGAGGLRHSAGGLERDGKCFCSDARGKLHHHVAHFAVLGIEDAGAYGRAAHGHEPQLITFVRRSRWQPSVVSHHSFLRIIQHARMAFSVAFGRAFLRPERHHKRFARGDQVGLVARFGELLLLLLDGVVEIGELAVELLVVQPQQNSRE